MPGQRCFLQHPLTKRWSRIVTILSMRDDKRSYIVENEDGATFTRGRKLLRPCMPTADSERSPTLNALTMPFVPRRSPRLNT